MAWDVDASPEKARRQAADTANYYVSRALTRMQAMGWDLRHASIQAQATFIAAYLRACTEDYNVTADLANREWSK